MPGAAELAKSKISPDRRRAGFPSSEHLPHGMLRVPRSNASTLSDYLDCTIFKQRTLVAERKDHKLFGFTAAKSLRKKPSSCPRPLWAYRRRNPTTALSIVLEQF
jgi:hypothetical protein